MIDFLLIIYIGGFLVFCCDAAARNVVRGADWLEWVVSLVVAAAWPITLPIALDRRWRRRGGGDGPAVRLLDNRVVRDGIAVSGIAAFGRIPRVRPRSERHDREPDQDEGEHHPDNMPTLHGITSGSRLPRRSARRPGRRRRTRTSRRRW